MAKSIRALSAIARALNEPVMEFLALTALALAVAPLIFDLKPATARFSIDLRSLVGRCAIP
ncbi:MAG TPA: hypothetical protein VFC90_13800 [Planctomycetota bacterium]|nr:hypothetical protein [Planctomycetota bacterium]